jgi:hypothetical protein
VLTYSPKGQVLTIKSFVLLAIASPSYFDPTSCSLLTLAGYNGMIGAWLAILSMKFLTILDRSVSFILLLRCIAYHILSSSSKAASS